MNASDVTNLAMSSIVPHVKPGRIFAADGHKLGHTHVGFITAFCVFLARSGNDVGETLCCNVCAYHCTDIIA